MPFARRSVAPKRRQRCGRPLAQFQRQTAIARLNLIARQSNRGQSEF
jgi:hypothetical protein